MTIQNIVKLQACADVLGEMIGNFNAMPEDRQKALEASGYCLMAQSYVAEYALHLAKGMDPFDAMAATVNGETEIEIDEAKTIVLRILTAKPTE